jgi:multiple sugar transport system substrate-binding protein
MGFFRWLLWVGMVLIVACADVTPTPPSTTVVITPSKTPAIVPTAAATRTPTITPLRWRIPYNNSAETAVFTDVANQIRASHPQFDLTLETGSDDYYSKLWTDLAAGSAPDVFWLPATVLSDFVQSGHLLDLRDYANSTAGYNDTLFYPGPMFHLTFDPTSNDSGKLLWGLPRDVATFALYLNLDLLEETGSADPRLLARRNEWDWEAFRNLTQLVTDVRETAVGYGQNSWWGTHGVWVFGSGGSYLSLDRSSCQIDSAESLRGLDFERSLFDDLRVAVPLDQSAAGSFLAGDVGMYLDGRWFTSTTREQADFEWDVVALPTGAAGAFNWLFWGAYVVNANSAHPKEAWELVWALSSADIQQYTTSAGINLPSRVGAEYIQAFLDSIPPINNAAFLAGLDNAVAEAPLWNANFAAVDGATQKYISQLLRGEISEEYFSLDVCRAVNALLP